jgi:long-chain acyl-CoA synthetase
MQEPKRLFDFPRYQLERLPLEKCITWKYLGKWKSYSSRQLVDEANKLSRGLLRMGIKKGERIALISHNNRGEWNVCDIGILQAGAIDVPVYPTMSKADFVYIFNHAEVSFCFVSNAELFHKLNDVKDQIPGLREIFTFEPVEGAKSWEEVLQLGEDPSNMQEVRRISDGIAENDLATLIYTSGTTGVPKGVMLSHRNIATNALASSERLPSMNDGNGRALSFLPVCHIYERMMQYLYLYNSVSLYFAESLETIKEDLQVARPHAFTAVPRLLEKFFDGIVAKGSQAEGIKKTLFLWAVDLALAWEPGNKNGILYEIKLAIARKLVFSKVKAALGLTEIMAVASGSAALQPRLARFFNGAGIPVFEGYGLTETSPVICVNTMNKPNMLRIGTVGKPIREVEVKIAEDGEILCKGPNVMMGYYKDAELTSTILKEGWFYTGDIGEFRDGFLKITDRKKEIFKTSGGKYVAPQLLENALKESPFIEQVIVVGEGRHFPAALIVPNFPSLSDWCKKQGIAYTSESALINNGQVMARLRQDVDKSNDAFGRWEQIKEFRLLDKPFTIEDGDLTPTLKLKRKAIEKKYADIIEQIYQPG